MQKIKHTPLFGAVFGLCLLLFIFAVTAIGASASEQNQSNSVYPVRRDARAVTEEHRHKIQTSDIYATTFTALTPEKLTNINYELTSGNYYLSEDLTISKPIVINGGGIVTICLNGHILKQTGNYSVISFSEDSGTTLKICDCRPDNEHANLPANLADTGITGGLITGGKAYNNGGGISANSGRTNANNITLYGGTIAGNTARQSGGGVYLSDTDSSIQMYGGAIRYNTANYGGGISMEGSNMFSMTRGTISDNTATTEGGGVHFINAHGSFSMSDNCTISNNTAGQFGGAIYSNKTFKMTGGVISGNHAGEAGGAIYCSNNMTNVFTALGNPQVYNNTAGTSNTTNNIYLNYKRSGNSSNYTYTHQLIAMSTSQLDSSARIGVTVVLTPPEEEALAGGQEPPIAISTEATRDTLDYSNYSSCFVSDNENHSITYDNDNKKLFYIKSSGDIPNTPQHQHAMSVACSQTEGDQISFQPLNQAKINTLQATSTYNTFDFPAGNYYLTEDITLTKAMNLPEDSTTNFCLNGHIINQTGDLASIFLINTKSKLSICDCAPDNSHETLPNNLTGITGGLLTGGQNSHGGAIYGSNSSTIETDSITFNMYGGTIAGNTVTAQGGGVFLGGSYSYFNMYGGTISHNTCKATASMGNTPNGGAGVAIGANTAFNMYGGEISNNKSMANGGGLLVNTNGKFLLNNGKITANTAALAGGAIYISQLLSTPSTITINVTINDGCISENHAQSGGAIYNYGNHIKINGGELSKNEATNGGAIYVTGSPAQTHIYGGTINDNKATQYGGAIYLQNPQPGSYTNSGTPVHMKNVVITNNSAGTDGGAIYAYSGNPNNNLYFSNVVKIYNNKLLDGTASNVLISRERQLNVLTSSGGLKSGSYIGISTNLNIPDGSYITLTGNSTYSSTGQYFFADDSDNYYVQGGGESVIMRKGGKHVHPGVTGEFTLLSPGSGFPMSLPRAGDTVKNYYLNENVILTEADGPLEITGDVNLCLNDNKLTVPAGITVKDGATLTLYAESTDQTLADLLEGGKIKVEQGGTIELVNSTSHDDADASAPDSDRKQTFGGAAATGDTDLTIKDGQISDGSGSIDGKTHQEIHDQYIGGNIQYNTIFNESLLESLTYSPGGDQHPPHANLYYYLPEGNYYMTQDVKLDHAVEIQNTTNFCLFDHFLTAYNSIWEYDMDHVFWVPDKAVLNVYDCMCDLTIIWLPGGSVHLRNGGKLNIYGNDGGRLSFTMTDGEDGGGTIYQYDPRTQTRPDDTTRPNNITLPKGVEVTGTVPGQPEASIKNSGDSLTLTQPSGKATTITPGSSEQESQPTLLPTQSTEENLLLAIPDNTEILPENGPKIVVQAPQTAQPDPGTDLPQTTLNADGALSTANPVTITPTPSADPSTTPAPITITPPDPTLAGPKLEIAPDGTTTAPVGTTITKNDLQLTVDTPQSGPTPASVQISPAGEVTLTPGSTVTATLPDNTPGSDPSRPSKTIVIALPDDTPADNAKVQLNDGGITAPPGSTLTTRGSKTIVIALPDNGSEQDVWFDDDGKIILPEGTKVKDPATGQETTITKEQNTLDPETGDLSHTENVPTKPDKPEDPAKPTDLPPGGSVTNDDGSEVKRPDKDTVTITPPGGTEPSVIIKNESDDLDSPENFEPKVDKDGNVIVTPPVSVKTDDENKPEIKIEKTKDDQPAKITPEGAAELPSGGEVTVKGEDDKPIRIEVPEGGGTVKPQPDGTISLPPGAKVTIDGQTSTVGEQGGTLNPETGTVTSNSTGGSGSGSGSGGGGGADPVQSGAEKESYVITASASFGGSINPDNQTVVQPGGTVVFTITPDPGFVISDVVVDGKSIGTPEKYEFTNVRAAHSIEAVFAASHSSHGHIGCPKDETCPIWPYTDSIPKSWYHDGVHYCIENGLTIGTGPAIYEPDIPLSRAMLAQVLYNKSGKPEVTGASEFDDVSEGDWQWYWPAVTWGGRNKVVLGYGDGNFGPDNPVTREQLCTMLWRYARGPAAAVGSNVHFSDSDQVSDWAAEAVRWASSRGIVNGYPDGSFDPKGIASRAEAAQMIMRYFK